jgi:hypothetical protein
LIPAPPKLGADFLAALVARCFLGAFPPVDLRAVCLVLAMVWLLIPIAAIWLLQLFYDGLLVTAK